MMKHNQINKKILSLTAPLTQTISSINEELLSYVEECIQKVKLDLLEDISKTYNIDINELKKKFLKTRKVSKKNEKNQTQIDNNDEDDLVDPIYKEIKLSDNEQYYYVYNKRFGNVINKNKEIIGYTYKGSDILVLLDNTVIIIKDQKEQIFEKAKYENGIIKLDNGIIINIDANFKKFLDNNRV